MFIFLVHSRIEKELFLQVIDYTVNTVRGLVTFTLRNPAISGRPEALYIWAYLKVFHQVTWAALAATAGIAILVTAAVSPQKALFAKRLTKRQVFKQ